MSRLITVFGLCMFIALAALPAFAAELYEDPATGQIFTKPGDGRVPLNMPAEKVGGLYEDQSGMVYSKPGEGRTPVAVAEAAPEAPASDYSTQAFSEAVRHVISDDDSTTYPKIKVGNLFYAKYSYNTNNNVQNDGGKGQTANANKFDLTRGYINFRAELTPEIKVRVTPDISRVAATTYVTGITQTKVGGVVTNVSTTTATAPNAGDYELRLKFGYVDFHDFLKAYPSLEVKVGQFEGPWLDYEENLWTYRMQNTMLVEREGFLNSADLGVNLAGKIPGGYGEWQADVDNGEGYHSDEVNKYKSFGARMTLTPMPNNDYLKGLHLTGFFTAGKAAMAKVGQSQQRDRAIGFIGYKYQDDLFLGAEYLWTRGEDGTIVGSTTLQSPPLNYKGSGYSLMAWYRMPFMKPIRLMGRFDQFDHDKDRPGASDTRSVFGVSYDLNKYLTFLVDDERQQADKRLRLTTGNKIKNQNLIEAIVQWKFN